MCRAETKKEKQITKKQAPADDHCMLVGWKCLKWPSALLLGGNPSGPVCAALSGDSAGSLHGGPTAAMCICGATCMILPLRPCLMTTRACLVGPQGRGCARKGGGPTPLLHAARFRRPQPHRPRRAAVHLKVDPPRRHPQGKTRWLVSSSGSFSVICLRNFLDSGWTDFSLCMFSRACKEVTSVQAPVVFIGSVKLDSGHCFL